jgi:hypothetical protein
MLMQIIFISLGRNKHWLRIYMRSALVILAAHVNYSYAIPQTFSGSAPSVEAKYDVDKDRTTVSAGTMLEENSIEVQVGFPPISTPMKEHIFLTVAYAHQGRRLTSAPNVVTMMIESRARQFRFGEGMELLSVIDGKRLSHGQMGYISRHDVAGFFLLEPFNVEYLRVDLPFKTFLTLARAKSATLIIGNKNLSLEDQNFNVLSAIANCMIGKAVPTTTTSVAGTANPTPGGKCPIQSPDIPAISGFKLGMSIQDVRKLSPEGAPAITEPDTIGTRSMTIKFPRPQDAYGSTRLNELKVRFFDDRICYMEATYSVGKEWRDRQKDFAYFISKELGISVTWKEYSADVFHKVFLLRCDAVSIGLNVSDEDARKGELHNSTDTWVAYAMLTLTDKNAESLLQQRREKNSK